MNRVDEYLDDGWFWDVLDIIFSSKWDLRLEILLESCFGKFRIKFCPKQGKFHKSPRCHLDNYLVIVLKIAFFDWFLVSYRDRARHVPWHLLGNSTYCIIEKIFRSCQDGISVVISACFQKLPSRSHFGEFLRWSLATSSISSLQVLGLHFGEHFQELSTMASRPLSKQVFSNSNISILEWIFE